VTRSPHPALSRDAPSGIMSVKGIAPHMTDKLCRTMRNHRCITRSHLRYVTSVEWARHPQRPGHALTMTVDVRHNYTYDGEWLTAARSQNGRAPRPWRGASPPAGRPRPAVRIARVFRCARPRPGEIRNGPSGRGRRPLGRADDRRV